jgi:cell division protein FtsL
MTNYFQGIIIIHIVVILLFVSYFSVEIYFILDKKLNYLKNEITELKSKIKEKEITKNKKKSKNSIYSINNN